MGLLVTMKGLPLAYNKDMQEDKEGAFDAAITLGDCMQVMAGMLATMQVNADRMLEAAQAGHMAATDVADYLVRKGLPFRKAHEAAGHLVLLADTRGCSLADLSLADFKAESDLFEEDIVGALDLEAIVNARETEGGTGKQALAAQFERARATMPH